MSDISADAIDWNEGLGTVFQGRKDIIEIRIAEGTKRIPDGAFKDCTELEKVNLPDGLETIGREAFSGCIKLNISKLPKSLKEIGERAFYGCASIESFEIEDGNDSLNLYKGVVYSKDWNLISYPAGCREKKYGICEKTKKVNDYAFNGNPYIRSIGLWSEVSDITGKAFLGCRKLERIFVNEDNEKYLSASGSLFAESGTALVFLPPVPRMTYLLLVGIRRLETHCLAECRYLDMLKLHNCLEFVAEDAFGEECRPKKLDVDTGFDCKVPFRLVDSDDLSDCRNIGGKVYLRGRNGEYRQIAVREQPEDPFSEYEEPDFEMIGRDDPAEMKFKPVKVTDTGFDDIAGLDYAKDMMYRHLILPAKHPELFEKFDLEGNTGILLYGPPGTGKTMLARAVASEMDAKFYSIKSTDIRNCYVGESENNIRRLFETARQDTKAVIFFDDFDSLGRARGNNGEPWQSDLIDEILVQMQGIEKNSNNLMVLAATNRPWEIDSALMRSGRFSTHIHVGLPNNKARETIICSRMSKVPHADDLDICSLVSRTEGYNAADVDEMCKTAKMHRVVMMDSGDNVSVVTMDDFEYALSKVHSSVSKKDLRDIEEYMRSGTAGTPSSDEGHYDPSEGRLPGYY